MFAIHPKTSGPRELRVFQNEKEAQDEYDRIARKHAPKHVRGAESIAVEFLVFDTITIR